MSTLASPSTTRDTWPPSLLTAEPDQAGRRPLDGEARRDLLVGRLVERLTKGRGDYRLDDWLTTLVPARDVDYRHEVFSDLQDPHLRTGLVAFSTGMQHVRRILAMTNKLFYAVEQRRWYLQVARDYTMIVHALADALHEAALGSAALQGLAAWVQAYVASPGFHKLSTDAGELIEQFDAIQYRVRVHADFVEVRPVNPDEAELASRVLATFERFQQGAPKSYLQQIRDPGSMDHVEAAIASFLSRLFPEPFDSLAAFCARYDPLVPDEVTRAERELQFYLAYLDLIDQTGPLGVRWSLPEVGPDHELSIHDGYDIALVLGTAGGDTTVPNDCQLSNDERLVVVTGPNQGGKTTFARMLGQLHLLAATGAPVPTRTARIPLVEQIFTLFERGENLEDLRGHLHDDLTRAHTLLEHLTERSLVLLNEVYSSTSPDDALSLGQDLLTRLEESGARSVCVTFLDELSHHSPTTVSIVAGVDAHDRTRRTYRLERRAADGLAYTRALAQLHHLTAQDLHRRLAR